ncbi:serine protease [Saccharothrix xinjiangensis]|uniref:Serine protease n=1 Tax=Saccharothrix xinjiangensis TaxID=204798 RepID=A0ABV9XUV5_9PSEU
MGAGFLVAPDLVCSCAHVLGDGVEPPFGPVRVDFPMLPGVPARTAHVELWEPVRDDGRGDVVLLRLTERAPEGSAALVLGSTEDPWGQRFRVPGFPADREDGVWVGGGLRERQGTGWVQMQADDGPRIARGFSGSPVWSEDLEAVVGMTVAAESGSGTAYLIPSETLVAVSSELAPPCPFRGLHAFRAEDARYFFGRDDEVDELVARIGAQRVTVVAGPSGCGKSSLVDAGLRPRLEAAGTPVSVVRPVPGRSASELPAGLRPSAASGSVLVVDQFEEVVAADPATAREALRLLDELTEAPDGPRVVLTLRAGSLDDLLAGGDAPALGEPLFLTPLRGDRLRAAVERPVAITPGLAHQDGLVDRIVSDASAEPGLLPLVEFTLTELWKNAEAGVLTLRAYDAMGGVAGALAGHAERFYAGLGQDDRDPVRRLLVRLTRHTADGFAVRPTTVEEVFEELRRAIDVLLGARLVVLRGDEGQPPVLAPAHEALLRTWPRLRGWLEADREFLSWQAGVRERADQWQRAGRDRGLVLRGGPLATARQWLDRRPDDVDRLERDFVAAGHAVQRRAALTRRAAVAVLVVLLLTSGLLTARTVAANQELDTTVRHQAARLLADLSERESRVSATSALQFGLAAWRHDPALGYGALLRQQAMFHDVAEVDLDRYAVAMADVATDPTGHVAVTASATGALAAWRDPWGATPETWPLGTVEHLEGIRVSDNGRRAAVIDSSGAVRVWDLDERGAPVVVRPSSPGTDARPLRDFSMEISPSGDRVVLVNDAGAGPRVEVWDVARPSRPTGFTPATPLVIASIGDDSGTAAFLEEEGEDDALVVRSLDTGAEVRSTPGAGTTARQGRMALTCRDNVLAGWDAFSGAEVFRRPLPRCHRIATDLTGEFLLIESSRESGSFTAVTYLDPRDGRAYQSSSPGSDVALGHEVGGGTVVQRSADGVPVVQHVLGTGVVRMRPPRPVEDVGTQLEYVEVEADLANPAYSGDGSLMAVVGGEFDGEQGLTLIDPRTRRRLARAPDLRWPGRQFLHFTPDNTRLLLFDGPDLLVLDTRDLTELRRLRLPHPDELADRDGTHWPHSVTTPDDRTAVVLYAGLLTRWNLDSGAPVDEPLRLGDSARDLRQAAEEGVVLGTPDRDRVLVSTARGQQWWDLRGRAAGDLIAPEPESQLRAAALDGSRLTIQYSSGRAYLHDLGSGTTSPAIPLTAHTKPIGFTPDGKLVVKDDEQLVQVWDPATAQLLGAFHLPQDTVSATTIGSSLIGMTEFGFVSVDLDPSHWFQSLCAGASRGYSQSELDRLPDGADRGNPCS